ncbi:MAG: DUF1549 domain-containing protein, partial [Planctomycetota bacterium]
MRSRQLIFVRTLFLAQVLFVSIVFVGSRTVAADSATVKLTFERDVRPILKIACFHCHGEFGEKEGGLDLRLVRLMRQGGESGPAISSNRPEQSLLWKQIVSDKMPRAEKKLSARDKSIIRRWIEAGAPTARPEPEDVNDAKFTHEELSHWAFQPVILPEVPTAKGYEVRNPIDAFIAVKLKEAGLPFSKEASSATLARRLSFGLLGLPPSSGVVADLASATGDREYVGVVERLLASPQFGVRWGRHWLDVAGYAETDGGNGSDPKRPNAWRYRDYVVDSFNSGKRIDEFYLEQLAGDELIRGKRNVDDARQLELLTATGFLRLGPDA